MPSLEHFLTFFTEKTIEVHLKKQSVLFVYIFNGQLKITLFILFKNYYTFIFQL